MAHTKAVTMQLRLAEKSDLQNHLGKLQKGVMYFLLKQDMHTFEPYPYYIGDDFFEYEEFVKLYTAKRVFVAVRAFDVPLVFEEKTTEIKQSA